LAALSFLTLTDGSRVTNALLLQNIPADEIYVGAGYVRSANEEGAFFEIGDDTSKDLQLHLTIDQGLEELFIGDAFVPSRE